MTNFKQGVALVCATISCTAIADIHHGNYEASGHAPAAVMSDHMHKAGEFMIGYRAEYDYMEGQLSGSTSVSNEAVLDQYRAIGRDMSMTMHMLDFMYAPSDDLTLMIMPMYMEMDMTMEMNMMSMGGMMNPMTMTTMTHAHQVSGWADTKLAALWRLPISGGHWHLTTTLSVPTGATDLKNRNGVLTHYTMQLGSGTYDFEPQITYTDRDNGVSWGVQLGGIYRLQSENDQGYRLGHRIETTAWGSYDFNNGMSVSARLVFEKQGQIEGGYNAPHAMGSPADFTQNSGKEIATALVGVNTAFELSGQLYRVGLEAGVPVYQSVNGIQMEQQEGLYLNMSSAF